MTKMSPIKILNDATISAINMQLMRAHESQVVVVQNVQIVENGYLAVFKCIPIEEDGVGGQRCAFFEHTEKGIRNKSEIILS